MQMLFTTSEVSRIEKLNQAIDRFCILHPNFGIPNLMLYVVIGNVVLGLLSGFPPAIF